MPPLAGELEREAEHFAHRQLRRGRVDEAAEIQRDVLVAEEALDQRPHDRCGRLDVVDQGKRVATIDDQLEQFPWLRALWHLDADDDVVLGEICADGFADGRLADAARSDEHRAQSLPQALLDVGDNPLAADDQIGRNGASEWKETPDLLHGCTLTNALP